MRAIEINPELSSVKEKIYGFELDQLVYIGISGALSLLLNFKLPEQLGIFRGIVASLVAIPFILVAIKDFYGLKGWRLGFKVIISFLNNKPLIFESENIWKDVRKIC